MNLENIEYLAVIDADNTNDDLWFASWHTNGIFKLNLKEMKIEFVDYFHTQNFINKYIRQVRCVQNEICFFNMFHFQAGNDGIVVMNMNDMQQKSYWKFGKEEGIYQDVIQRGEELIALPVNIAEPLIIFDTKTKKITEVSKWVTEDNIVSVGRMVCAGDRFYAACLQTDKLLMLNGSTLKADIIKIDGLKFQIYQLISNGNGDSFFATGLHTNQFLEWDNGSVQYISLPQGDYCAVRGTVCYGKLYLFPEEKLHDIIVYQIETGEFYTLPIPDCIHVVSSGSSESLFSVIKTVNDAVVALPRRVDGFLIIDAIKDEVSYVSNRIDLDLAKKCYYKSLDLREAIKESSGFSLSDYLHCVDCIGRG